MREEAFNAALKNEIRDTEEGPFDTGRSGEPSILDKKCLESLIQNSQLAIVTLDQSHHILACNQYFERLFQYKESEIVGKNLDELIGGGKYLDDATSYTSETLQGKAIHGSGKRLRNDRAYIDVEFFGVPVIVDEKIRGAYGIYIDVSEKVRAGERLKLSEKRYRDLYEGSLDGYAMVNMEGKITESNSTFRQMLGYTEDELQGLTYEDITPVDWHATDANIIEKQVLPRGYSDLFEKEFTRKDGTIFPVEIRAYLLRDEKDRPAGMWAFLRDITERKRAETTLHESEQR